jgi:MSHA biogenesis protein MshP
MTSAPDVDRSRARRRHARGFAFVTAIFLLVVLASFAAFVVSITSNAAAAGAAAIQGTRAYDAARAGLEWAGHQVRDPNGTLAPGATNLPDCFASPRTLALPGELAHFTVTLTCARTPAIGAVPNFHEEGDKRTAVYVIFATASFGVAGGPDYVERRLETRIEKCKDPAAGAPSYAC